MSYNSMIFKGNPCTRDCPDRQPGCNCEKRKEFRKVYEERKAEMKRQKDEEDLILSTRYGKGRRYIPNTKIKEGYKK